MTEVALTAHEHPSAPEAHEPVPHRLHSLTARDFRNLAQVSLSIPPDGLAIVGDNGQGKTNLLEAIYYLELLRSVRGARDVELVRFGEIGFHLNGVVDRAGAPHEIGVGFERASKRKRVRVDGVETRRLSDALGVLPSAMISPRDVSLVTGTPGERRRFLDVTLALSSRRYLTALQHYRGALAHRNAALREYARGAATNDAVAVWEPALAEHGATLWLERVRWAESAAPSYTRLCARMGERATARIRYATTLTPQSQSIDDVRVALADAFERKRSLDLRRGLTHAGPHRDDLELSLDGRELRTFGSAGQQRTSAIALRMLEADTLREATGAMPVLLLDDPFAELDARRTQRILELLSEAGTGQTILAVPKSSDIPAELTRLSRVEIRDGELR